jgi:hypothetical protein
MWEQSWNLSEIGVLNSSRARQEEAQRRTIAERPSLENLPEIPAQNVERLIVLHSIHDQEIDGMSANQRGARNARADGRPPSVAYYASYGSMDGRFHPGYVPLVRAIVTVYPSAEWAQYELRNIPTFILRSWIPNAQFRNEIRKQNHHEYEHALSGRQCRSLFLLAEWRKNSSDHLSEERRR